jgi:phosphatidylserine/phosphatidylglycerophosphate/cardiolipin synthase-like enzyme
LPVYCNDIINAEREVLIVSPFVTKRRVTQMLQYFNIAASKQIKIVIITRPAEDFNEKNRSSLVTALDALRDLGIKIIYRSNIHQKFAIIDQKIVWYGSINLLSFGKAEESIMRLDSSAIASELIRSIDKVPDGISEYF